MREYEKCDKCELICNTPVMYHGLWIGYQLLGEVIWVRIGMAHQCSERSKGLVDLEVVEGVDYMMFGM